MFKVFSISKILLCGVKNKYSLCKEIPFVLIGLFLHLASFATVFTVTNTADNGSGSLRDALTNALYYPSGPHSVAFNIPVSDLNYNAVAGTWTITLTSTLPIINKSNIVIDATTQTSNQGDKNPLGPEVVLDGNHQTVDNAFFIYSASATTIKGFCIKSFLYGIQIFGSSSSNNIITGNYIGINAKGNAIDSCYIGIEIMGSAHHNTVGGTAAGDRNVVSGNSHIGVRIANGNYNMVIGNYIGTDRSGTFALPNYDGMSIEGSSKYNIIGGTLAAERNIISGNVAYGIPAFGAGCSYNRFMGNYVGTDVTGTQSIPNTYGLLFDDGASENIVGGSEAGARNVLSGNSGYGVFLYNMGTRDNVVKGNYIGIDASGTTALPNANGIVVDGAPIRHVIDSNVISGNLQQGIAIHITHTDSTVITRNFIGTDKTGALPVGNGMDGIQIAEGPKYTLIGGSPQMGNVIAFNGGNGITIMTAAEKYNKISCNSIFNNGGLGIDLYPPGVTVNDAGDTDNGPNDLQNFPVITAVVFDSVNGTAHINGTLDTQNPSTATVEIFIADANAAVYGEGKTFLGAAAPDALGNWSANLQGVQRSDYITTTATSASGSTSEFSLNAAVDANYVTAITEIKELKNIKIYPNPANDIAVIDFGKTTQTTIYVYDLTGKRMGKYPANTMQTEISVAEYASGTYLIVMKEENTVSHKYIGKLVVEKSKRN